MKTHGRLQLACPSSCWWTTLSPTPWVLHLRMDCRCQNTFPNFLFKSLLSSFFACSGLIFPVLSSSITSVWILASKSFWSTSCTSRAVERSLWTSSTSVSFSRQQWWNVDSSESERCFLGSLLSSSSNTPQLSSLISPSSCNIFLQKKCQSNHCENRLMNLLKILGTICCTKTLKQRNFFTFRRSPRPKRWSNPSTSSAWQPSELSRLAQPQTSLCSSVCDILWNGVGNLFCSL